MVTMAWMLPFRLLIVPIHVLIPVQGGRETMTLDHGDNASITSSEGTERGSSVVTILQVLIQRQVVMGHIGKVLITQLTTATWVCRQKSVSCFNGSHGNANCTIQLCMIFLCIQACSVVRLCVASVSCDPSLIVAPGTHR